MARIQEEMTKNRLCAVDQAENLLDTTSKMRATFSLCLISPVPILTRRWLWRLPFEILAIACCWQPDQCRCQIHIVWAIATSEPNYVSKLWIGIQCRCQWVKSQTDTYICRSCSTVGNVRGFLLYRFHVVRVRSPWRPTAVLYTL